MAESSSPPPPGFLLGALFPEAPPEGGQGEDRAGDVIGRVFRGHSRGREDRAASREHVPEDAEELSLVHLPCWSGSSTAGAAFGTKIETRASVTARTVELSGEVVRTPSGAVVVTHAVSSEADRMQRRWRSFMVEMALRPDFCTVSPSPRSVTRQGNVGREGPPFSEETKKPLRRWAKRLAERPMQRT